MQQVKRAIVIGASSDIGLEVAKLLIGQGWTGAGFHDGCGADSNITINYEEKDSNCIGFCCGNTADDNGIVV
jgi:NAD(P)-dependent dehydrogenase (short-subunit alcohol dehydrogenase family)